MPERMARQSDPDDADYALVRTSPPPPNDGDGGDGKKALLIISGLILSVCGFFASASFIDLKSDMRSNTEAVNQLKLAGANDSSNMRQMGETVTTLKNSVETLAGVVNGIKEKQIEKEIERRLEIEWSDRDLRERQRDSHSYKKGK